MKILICHNYYQNFGGEDVSVNALIQLLQAEGQEVLLFSKKSSEIARMPIHQRVCAGVNGIYSGKIALEFRDVLKNFEPDLVHVHNVFPIISPAIYHVLHQLHIPTVQTVHNFRWLCPNGLFYTQNSICMRCASGNTLSAVRYRCLHGSITQSLAYALSVGINRKFANLPSAWATFIFLSQFTADLFQKYLNVPAENSHVLSNFLSEYPLSSEDLAKDRFIFLGRISPEKGAFMILEAAALLPSVLFQVIGSGPLEETLKAKKSKMGLTNVIISGFLGGEERFEPLRRAFALILPSQCLEQFPMAVLEAFRMGIPVVASDLGGLSEIVTNGENGYLFPPGDVLGLVVVLKKILEDVHLRQNISKNALFTFQKNYTQTIFYPRLMQIYQQAIARREK